MNEQEVEARIAEVQLKITEERRKRFRIDIENALACGAIESLEAPSLLDSLVADESGMLLAELESKIASARRASRDY